VTQPSPQWLADIDGHVSGLLGRIERREVLCAAAGLKPIRLMAEERATDELVDALQAAGLSTAVSRHQTWIVQDQGKGGWSSACAEPGHGVPFRHLYVARAAAAAAELRDAEESGSAEVFGRLLLVPSCCRQMFITRMRDAASAQNDYLTCTFSAPRCDVHWQLNLAAQYFDAALISHYPCGPRCADSIRLASLAWRIALHSVPMLAHEIRADMNQPILYTDCSGVHMLRDARQEMDGWLRVDAGSVKSTAPTRLGGLLDEGGLLRVVAADGVEWLTPRGTMQFREQGARLLVPHSATMELSE
jgi:hypothetical protein